MARISSSGRSRTDPDPNGVTVNTSIFWYQELVARLAWLRRAVGSVEILTGAVRSLISLVALAVCTVVLEMMFFFGPAGRTALVVVLGLSCAVATVWYLGLPLLRRTGLLQQATDHDLARLTGRTFPEIRDRLVNVLELQQAAQAASSPYSSVLIEVAGTQVANELRPLDLSRVVDSSPIRRSFKTLAVILLALVCMVVFFPSSFPAAASRIVHYSTAYAPSNAVRFSFEPGSTEILKGSRFTTVVRVSPLVGSEMPDLRASLTFLWKPETQARPERVELVPDSPGVYRASIDAVRMSGDFAADFNNFQSAWHHLAVLDQPVLRSFRVRLDYPRYSGLPPRIQEEFLGDLAALPGTTVTLTGVSTNEIRSARVHFSTGEPQPAQVRGRSFTASFPVTSATLYSIDLEDTRGMRLSDPITYSVVVVDDQVPLVELVQPGRNMDIADETVLPLLVRIADDYGFSSLRLSYRLVQSRYEPPWERPRLVDIPLPAALTTAAEVSYAWSLDPLDLVPEDVVEYSVQVFDNDNIRGPKSAQTPLFLLRLPSLDEVFADAEMTQQRSLEEMQKSLQQAEDLGERLDEIRQDLKQDKPSEWQQQKNLEELAKQYEAIDRSLAQVQQQLEQMVSSIQQQAALSPETLEKYLELQELFEQLDSQELQRALQQLQQAMQGIDRQRLQEAMQQVTLSEDRFRESIERTMNLLKRIQIEQNLDEALRRSEDLRSRQEDLREDVISDTTASRSDQQLADRQKDLEQAQRKLQESMRDLQKRMEEFFADMPLDQMEELNRQLTEQRLPEQMDRAAAQLRSGNRRNAANDQERILQQLQSLSEDLRTIQQELLQQQSQYTVNALRQAAMNLLEISRRQEALKNESLGAQGNSPAMRENAQDQVRALEALSAVAQSLSQLGQRSFAVTPQMASSIGDAVRGMQNALRSLDMRNGQAASRAQTEAMGALNASAMAVQDALDAMARGGSGTGMGGLLQQLQALAGQQQALNARTQSMDAAAQAARLAAEQAAIQKSLEQLNREAQRAADGERLLGDLDRVAQDMREVVRSLEQEQLNPETLQRQERILSRLLDASRSLRERDFEKRRKATTGSPLARPSAPELDPRLQGDRDRLRQDLLRALEQGYSQEYEQLIRRYFEALQGLDASRR